MVARRHKGGFRPATAVTLAAGCLRYAYAIVLEGEAHDLGAYREYPDGQSVARLVDCDNLTLYAPFSLNPCYLFF